MSSKLPTPAPDEFQIPSMSDTQLQMRDFARALHHARTRRQLSIETVSKECQLSDNQIRGLESADVRPFYSAAYALRGAERFARYLGIGPVPHVCITRLGTQVRQETKRVVAKRQTRARRWGLRLKRWIDPLRSSRNARRRELKS